MSAHESRSERFRPIPAIEVLRGLAAKGFVAVGAKQSATRTEGKIDFTKHLIRLRRVDEGKVYRVGDTVCQILLKNANDGTSGYELLAGLFRIRCMNSLVTQTGTIDAIKVRHAGAVGAEVIEGTYRVLNEAERTFVAPQDWSTHMLNRDEKQILAEAAHVLRFGDSEGETTTPIKPEQLLMPRHHEPARRDHHILEHHEAGRSRRQSETRGKIAIARFAGPCLVPRVGAHQSHRRISLAKTLV